MCGPMASLRKNEYLFGERSSRSEKRVFHRRRPLRVLFIHRDADAVDSCLQELKKAQFAVSADTVLTLEQGTEQICSGSYDVLVAEYPSSGWKGPQALQLLRQTAQETPLLFVTSATARVSITELTAHGAFDYIEEERVAQLPMAVRRALNEKELRTELQEARMALRHSQSLYRALVDNPAYGICRCNAEGEFLNVNQALINMLGYESKAELLAVKPPAEIFTTFGSTPPPVRQVRTTAQIDPIEIEWQRKNGTMLKARVSGRGIYDDRADLIGHEFIVVDITEQRMLEEHLRQQALSDSLTGLANHRRLFEVLHSEISRSHRTEREFSLILLDLDGLKEINDRFGHLTGDRALCRLGQILSDCSRSIDTAARHGGDEFALVLPETGLGAATLVARRICELLEQDSEKPVLSVSAGVASFPKDAETIGTLLYAADKVLYEMKSKQPRAARAARAS
jgi:diguanylate cyclase (GGDEF)-like protein/PAS domain S-box-containing protein